MDITAYILSKFPGVNPNSSGKIHTYCPFHADSHPSFSIDLDKGGLFICGSASCGVKGSFPLFYKMMENLDNWSAVYRALSDVQVSKHFEFTGLEQEREKEIEIIPEFPSVPFIQKRVGIPYLLNRGLDDSICDLFSIYYGVTGDFGGISIENSLVFPIYDACGVYKSFYVRYLREGKRMRWQHPAKSPFKSYVYGGWLASQRSKYLWVVEGPSDVWRLFQLGQQAVGLFSTNYTSSQLNRVYELCSKLDLMPIVALDGDATVKNKKLFMELSAYGLDVESVWFEKEEDPGGLSEERLRSIVQNLEG